MGLCSQITKIRDKEHTKEETTGNGSEDEDEKFEKIKEAIEEAHKKSEELDDDGAEIADDDDDDEDLDDSDYQT